MVEIYGDPVCVIENVKKRWTNVSNATDAGVYSLKYHNPQVKYTRSYKWIKNEQGDDGDVCEERHPCAKPNLFLA